MHQPHEGMIAFMGDLHGDDQFLRQAAKKIATFGCDTIVQLGDNGVWPWWQKGGPEWLRDVEKIMRQYGLVMVALTGNHDWHEGVYSADVDDDGFHVLTDRLRFAPRGHRWTWSGVEFLAIGGAHSVDKAASLAEMRKKNKKQDVYGSSKRRYECWWETETVTPEQAAKAMEGGHADIVVAHDVPLYVDMAFQIAKQHGKFLKGDDGTVAHRRIMTDIFDAVRPHHWFHGHYHLRYTDRVNGCTFEGLATTFNYHRANFNQLDNWTIRFLDQLGGSDGMEGPVG